MHAHTLHTEARIGSAVGVVVVADEDDDANANDDEPVTCVSHAARSMR